LVKAHQASSSRVGSAALSGEQNCEGPCTLVRPASKN